MKFKEFIREKLGVGMIKESPDLWYRDRLDDEDNQPKKMKKADLEPETKDASPFKVGDILVLIDTKKSSKIPDDAWDFLMTYKEYEVHKVSDTGKVDLGCHISKNTPDGGVEKIYLFSPKRFALKNASDKHDTQNSDIESFPLPEE